MWVQKTNIEIKQLKREKLKNRFIPIVPLVIAILVSVFEGFRDSFSTIGSDFIFVFIGAYISQLLFGTPEYFLNIIYMNAESISDKLLICNKCKTTQQKQKFVVCDCGGDLEPIENWKWVNKN